MKSQEQILFKIKELEQQILFINSNIEMELKKIVIRRDVHLLKFLYFEYKIYKFALENLEWSLSSADHSDETADQK